MEINLTGDITVKFPNREDAAFSLRIGNSFTFYLYSDDSIEPTNNTIKCKIDGMELEFSSKDSVYFNESLLRKIHSEYAQKALKTSKRTHLEGWLKMNRNVINAVVFDLFLDKFEECLCLMGAEVDPQSFDHLNPNLSNYLIRVRDALLKYYGLRIFSPNN